MTDLQKQAFIDVMNKLNDMVHEISPECTDWHLDYHKDGWPTKDSGEYMLLSNWFVYSRHIGEKIHLEILKEKSNEK